MAQKDKVKELVGRSLDSYHTKTLQQIDRIEKKNREQNHKISILTNELDNDYLTKTEEGSAVFLEHSKEGMIYLDELQGNTLVNLATIKNGNFDFKPTASNGKTIPLLKKINSVFTVIVNVTANTLNANCKIALYCDNNVTIYPNGIPNTSYGIVTFKLEPFRDGAYHNMHSFRLYTDNTTEGVFAFDDLIILEGDYSNKPIPKYFEGMKSVGQDNENGHKIEVSSNNKNLLKWDRNTVSTGSFNAKGFTYSVDANNTITVSGTTTDEQADLYLAGGWNQSKAIQTLDAGTYTASLSNLEKDITFYLANNSSVIASTGYNGKRTFTITEPIDITAIFIRMKPNIEFTNKIVKIQLEKGSVATSYIQPKQNKKEISVKEPLRASPNGVKDKLIKQGNKWYIQRNCGEVEIVNTMTISMWGGVPNTINNAFVIQTGIKNKNDNLKKEMFLSDKYVAYPRNYLPANDIMGICDSQTQGSVLIKIPSTNLSEYTVDAFKTWLGNNPFKVVYQLETPTYEEIPFELQKIILEGYENGTLFFDTNIPPTSTVTYAGEAPIAKSVKLNKTEVLNNTTDINDNILPYLMDMDYRVVVLQLEHGVQNMSMARLFGGTYEMLERDIKSNRLSKSEYANRLADYFNAKKLSGEEYLELEKMIYE